MDFLLQIPEQLGIEEILNRDSQTIADLLDRGNGGTAVSFADNVVYRGLGHAARATELVNGNVTLAAQFQKM